MNSLIDFLNHKCGGVAKVSELTGVSSRAIYKWAAKNTLPRTEYTGETNYTAALSKLADVPADEIKNQFNPSKAKN